ncbi:MAG TPA: 1-deoxy-D-xylulose-5-phosphate synthase N-terminal domain-containing protein, partial [Myxococcota bacterium]|nr:1-deoxy-D-xylulose-5-phosphate synthase N-terminal domain-containing protein [Myxococcota bacterium]
MLDPHDVKGPEALRSLSIPELEAFAGRVRDFLIDTTARTGGHIGANLGTVELSLALHHVFDS